MSSPRPHPIPADMPRGYRPDGAAASSRTGKKEKTHE